MKRVSFSQVVAVAALALSALSLGTACGSEFDSIAQVKQLRVMAVKKTTSYAQPGEQIDLAMLYHDGASETPRDIEVMWLSGCENPPADLYEPCFEALGPALASVDAEEIVTAAGLDRDATLDDLFRSGVAARAGRVPLGPGIVLGFQDTFTLDVASDIISKRPPPAPGQVPYGLNYVFFAACAGELHLDLKAEGFPIRCLDEDGDVLGAEDFVVGYSAVYAYDDLGNSNPRILGFEVDGKRLAKDKFCIGSECEVIQPDPERKCNASDPEVRACKDEEGDSCPKLPIRALIDPKSVELDGVLTRLDGSDVDEQMWLNFHTDNGKFTFDLALVNDSSSGFREDTETEFVAPEQKGPTQVWTVVRDNRGGAEWARFQICVQ